MTGDGSDPMFAHTNVEKDDELESTMASVREAEKEIKNKAAADKAQHMAELAVFAKVANVTKNATANVTKFSVSDQEKSEATKLSE